MSRLYITPYVKLSTDLSRKALPVEDSGTSGSSGLPWGILAPEVCDGEYAGMAGVQSMALTWVSPFLAFKLSTVSLEESCRYHVNAVCLAA